MAYLLDFDEVTVVPYLQQLGFSPAGLQSLSAVLQRELGEHGDSYRHDPERRLSAESDCFSMTLVFRDPATTVIHQLRLIVSDAPASFGILRVVYADDGP